MDLGIRQERPERQLSRVDGIPKLLVIRTNLLIVMDQPGKNKLVVDGTHRLRLHWKLRECHLTTILVTKGNLLHEKVRNFHLDADLVIEQVPIIGLSPAA